MIKTAIPALNSEFDLRLLLLIARRSLLWVLLLLAMALGIAFVYLRYTPQVYETGTIIKLGQQDQGNKILNIGKDFFEENTNMIAGAIELIRSDIILQRAVSRLPLRVSYYAKGRVMSNELYRKSPFTVEVALSDSSAVGVPIFAEFSNELVQLFVNKTPICTRSLVNRWIITPYGSFRVVVHDMLTIGEQQKTINQPGFYFVVNNAYTLAGQVKARLNVALLNEQAQTILIQVQDNNALKASDLTNAIAEEFNRYDLERKGEGAQQTLAFIEEQLQIVSEQLRSSEILLETFKRTNKIMSPETDTRELAVKYSDMESERLKLEVESDLLDKLLQNISENRDLSNLLPVLSDRHNSILASILSSIQRLEDEKEQMLLQATPQSSTVKFINSKIESKKKQLVQTVQALKKNLSDRQQEIRGSMKEYEDLLSRFPVKESEYNRIERLFTIREKFYSSLLEKKAEFQIVKAGLVSENVTLQKAVTPDVPISPRKTIIYVFAIFVALVIGLLIIIVRYLLHNEIVSVEDIRPYTNAPILGVVPRYKEAVPVSELIVNRNPKSLITEAFRSIRTNLQFISNSPGIKLIGITSTISGEGKTFVAINLGGVISFSGRKVIILDLDMRKPKIHLGFGVENSKGLSTILIGKDTAESCIHKSELENLDFITAGPIPPNPSELIISGRMDALLEELKKTYEVIIIDTPPVGIVTDGISIMQKADYPIYIMRSSYSKKYLIQNVNKLIDENHIRNLSVILNSLDREQTRYGYGYGYGYGDGYGYGYYEEDASDKRRKNLLRRIFNI
jgi:tyrosine-protein kinase Etk/Wzc